MQAASILLSLFLGGAASTTQQAQDVVVTARKREVRLQEEPFLITAPRVADH